MKELFNGIFEGKTVLVTGSTGFKGTWLSLWLSELGANVIGYALAPETQPSMFELVAAERQITQVYGDILDLRKLESTVKKYCPDVVFHLAAQPLVRESYIDPQHTFSTNIMGTVNLFEALRNVRNTKAIVNVTTDKVYLNNEWVYAYRENDVLGGRDPYSASKACSDLITAVYSQPFFFGKDVAIASVRAGNVFGGGDWSDDRLIPDVARSALTNQPLVIRNPDSIRPWQYVLEPLSGYLLLASFMTTHGSAYSGPWNFGPTNSTNMTVSQFIGKFREHWPAVGEVLYKRDDKFKESNILQLDWTKAATLLQWEPVFRLEESIDSTAKWYQAYGQGKMDREFTVALLNRYIDTAYRRGICWTRNEEVDL